MGVLAVCLGNRPIEGGDMPSMEIGPDGSMRRAQRRTFDGAWKAKRARILKDQSHCYICGSAVDTSVPGTDPHGPSVDHLIPVSQGGTDDPENLILTHLACNMQRGTKDIDEVRHTPQSRVW